MRRFLAIAYLRVSLLLAEKVHAATNENLLYKEGFYSDKQQKGKEREKGN